MSRRKFLRPSRNLRRQFYEPVIELSMIRVAAVPHRLGCLKPEFVVLAQPTITSEACKAAFHDPGQPNNFERSVLPLDDAKFITVMPP